MRAILHHFHAEKSVFPRPPKTNPHHSNRSISVLLTLTCDVTFLLIAVGIGLLLQALIVSVWPSTGNLSEKGMVEWMPFGAVVSSATGYLLRDLRQCWRSSGLLPFDYGENIFQQIYWRRLELILWEIASHLVLLCLCLLLPDEPLVSKLFLSGIVALISLAVHKSIPAQRSAFAASTGVFSMAMFVITMANLLS